MLTHPLSREANKKRLQEAEEAKAEKEILQKAQEHRSKEVNELKAALNTPLIGGLFNANLAASKRSALEKCQQEIAALNSRIAELLNDQTKITGQMSGIYDEIVQREPLQREMEAVVIALNASILQTQSLRDELTLKERERDTLLIECDEMSSEEKRTKKRFVYV
jgi:hypothetical protein